MTITNLMLGTLCLLFVILSIKSLIVIFSDRKQNEHNNRRPN